MIPLMSIMRNFFLGPEPAKGWGPLQRFDKKRANGDHARGAGEDRHRHPRPDQAVGTLSGGERQSRGDRPRRLFRRQGADPRRADLGARREAGGVVLRYIAAGEARGVGVDLHHPQRPPRLPGRRPLRDPQARARSSGASPRPTSPCEQLVQMMAGGAELETLAHELQEVAGDDPDLRQAVAELAQEVKTAPTVPRRRRTSEPSGHRRGGGRRGLTWTRAAPTTSSRWAVSASTCTRGRAGSRSPRCARSRSRSAGARRTSPSAPPATGTGWP